MYSRNKHSSTFQGSTCNESELSLVPTTLYEMCWMFLSLNEQSRLKYQSCYRYNRLLELPHLPDMVFPNNSLELKHTSGCKIEFNALDALKRVSNGKMAVKIACADAWKESR